MEKIQIVSGNICQIKVDALITAINSSGMWFGGVDGAIMSVAGNKFHCQAAEKMPLTDGKVIHAKANHDGKFKSVLFVVDDLQTNLYSLLSTTLKKADLLGIKSISVPTMRTGVMADAYESRTEALTLLCNAIFDFMESIPNHVQEIFIVVYNNKNDEEFIKSYIDYLYATC